MAKRLKYKYHLNVELPENPKEYTLVFGSNLGGLLGTEMGSIAQVYYGAQPGVFLGISGNSYSIPIKDRFIRILPITEIKKYVDLFISYTNEQPDRKFWITDIGNEKRGYKAYCIAPFFRGCSKNCTFPISWKGFLK